MYIDVYWYIYIYWCILFNIIDKYSNIILGVIMNYDDTNVDDKCLDISRTFLNKSKKKK